MLRLYKPIEHEIFELHELMEHLVCSVWCEADQNSCESKLQAELEPLLSYKYKKSTLENEIRLIYYHFRGLRPNHRNAIKIAFQNSNEIEKLCNGDLSPIHLSELHSIVRRKVKPLFIWFYEQLLKKVKVSGTKLDYYKKLIDNNDFYYCPCCGMLKFESTEKENSNREPFDHYLPKSEYPFASVNFKNLVPMCTKCNSLRKTTKNPIQNNQKAFYPFSLEPHEVDIRMRINPNKDLDELESNDITLDFDGNKDKIQTWVWLFDIDERYNNTTRGFSKSFLRKLKRRHKEDKKKDVKWSYIDTLHSHIKDYKYDEFEDLKFLKIAYLNELIKRKDLTDVYD